MDDRPGKESNAVKRLEKWRTMEIGRQTRMNERKYKVQIFYEKAMPNDIDLTKASVLDRKYTTNPKLGKLYEIRQERVPNLKVRHNQEKAPTRLQENNIWLWKNEAPLEHYLQSKGHKTVRQRDGLRLSSLRREQETSVQPAITSEHIQLRSLPTSGCGHLRSSSAKRAGHFRQRSASVCERMSGKSDSFELGDEEIRERSQSISDYALYRRPIVTTSTFNRPASEFNISTLFDDAKETLVGDEKINKTKPHNFVRPIPDIKITHVDDTL